DQAFTQQFGLDLPWVVYAAICLVVIAVLSHWDISVAAKVLGVVLVCEIGMLTISAVASLAHHPDGMSWTSLSPITALSTNGGGRRGGRPGPLDGVLVLGRVRIDGDLRRGVKEPEEDCPPSHLDRGHRDRRVLHLHRVGSDRRQRPRQGGRTGVGSHPVRSA